MKFLKIQALSSAWQASSTDVAEEILRAILQHQSPCHQHINEIRPTLTDQIIEEKQVQIKNQVLEWKKPCVTPSETILWS